MADTTFGNSNTDEQVPATSGLIRQEEIVPASISTFDTGLSGSVDNIDWIRQAFMLPNLDGTDISDTDWIQRIQTTAAYKFTDTTLGGNWAINPAPQFTRFADVTMGGDSNETWQSPRTLLMTEGGRGMGRYYSEVIDDNAQYVTMSFGVPAFNSLTSFFGNFYDSPTGTLVRTGRLPSLFFKTGRLAGALLALPFKPLILVNQIIKNAMQIPSTSFAYFKPTMTLYWEAVNTIVNTITANLGIHSRELSPSQQLMYVDPGGDYAGTGATQDLKGDIAKLHKFLPTIYTEDGAPSVNGQRGGIDIFAVATRAQALSDAYNKRLQNALENATSMDDLKSRISGVINGRLRTPAPKSMSAALKNYYESAGGGSSPDGKPVDDAFVESMSYGTVDDSSSTGGQLSTDANNALDTGHVAPAGVQANASTATTSGQTTASPTILGAMATWFAQFTKGLSADLSDGSQYVTFKVDYNGAIGESFGNSMRPSSIQERINSQSSSAREASYDFAGGNIVGGAVGKVIGGVVSSIKEVISGVASAVHLSGLAALAGAAYVDIPQMYDSSSVNLPNQSFSIELRSWSGHKLALLQNLYIPLAMLLAGVMPRSTGPASYNAPFVCQLYAKGRMQVRYGMITSMSIQRGTGNIGFTKEGLPLGIDITFEVTDFTSMMHMPIFTGMGFLDKSTLALSQAAGTVLGAAASAAGANTSAVAGGNAGEDLGAALTAGMYSDDSIFTDYMAVLAGLSIQDQVYPFRKWAIARDRMELNYDTFKSPYHAALAVNGTWPAQLISAFVRGTDRP